MIPISNILEEWCQEEIELEPIIYSLKDVILPQNLPKFLTVLSFINIILLCLVTEIKRENRTVHIAINIDKKYFYPCLVFLTSLLDNKKNSTIYKIHILKGNSIDETYEEKINTLITNFGKCNVKLFFYDMENDFRGATSGMYISIADYYRIALPSLLPTVDKILYIDTDVINLKDLTEMYSLEFRDDIYFMGTLDNIGLLNELKHIKNLTKYMNAGILMMNLKSMRKYGIEGKIRKYVRGHFLNHHDQTAINAVCHENLGILSIKYATFTFNSFKEIVEFNDKQNEINRYSFEELKQAFYDPTLLHFVGWVKPWHKGYKNKNQKYWWYYAKKCIYYQEILNHYGFKKKEVKKLLKKIPKNGGLLRRNYKKL